jgi:hypothetical protein
MNTALAEKLLIKVMNWGPEEIARERPLIQAMAKLKYDEYQQFSPGIRFTESLAQWLDRFTAEEKIVAYQFVRTQLIFISNEQMAHLVSICFPVIINPRLLEKAAQTKGIPRYHVRRIFESAEYKEIKRKSLFLGISDGAKIDQLRRNSGISNEQVFSSYYISSEKSDDMLKELHDEGYQGGFNSVYLIDDFTGSGLSYARIEKEKPTGKIIKFLKLIFNIDRKEDDESVLSKLIDVKDLDIHVIFYISRAHSLTYLTDFIEKWRVENKLEFKFSVEAIQVIGEHFKQKVLENPLLVAMSKKYITKAIIDRHYEKGKHEQYWLGFDECALPLILHHNTPNNSLPLLWWYPEDESFRGLFPRVTRHRE